MGNSKVLETTDKPSKYVNNKYIKGLIVKSLEGDSKATEELFTELRKQVFLLVERYWGEKFYKKLSTDDITQEVCMRIYLNLHTFDHMYSFITWFYPIVRYAVYDTLKAYRTRSKHIVASDAELFEVTVGQYKADQILLDESKKNLNIRFAERVKKAMNKLNPVQKYVWQLWWFEGLTDEEIVPLLPDVNCEGGVRAIRSRSRKRLKKILGDSKKLRRSFQIY